MRMKVKWPVKELVAKRQRRMIRGWMRHVESLRNDEEEMVQLCEPETGRNISDVEDELRSMEDLRDCQDGGTKISNCQVGNKMRSEDLIDCQGGSREIQYC